MSLVTHLTCVQCGQRIMPGGPMTCPSCGPDDGILDVQFDLAEAGKSLTLEALAFRDLSHWRYQELLPLPMDFRPVQPQVGWTPLIEAPRLAKALGIGRLRLKDDGRNPSGSFKDRPSSLAVAMAIAGPKALLERTTVRRDMAHCLDADSCGEMTLDALAAGMKAGESPNQRQPAVSEPVPAIACASTGNAASSLACSAAAAGLACYIFVPGTVPEGKLAQLLAYGATVFKIARGYAAAYDLCNQACAAFGWYNRNCAINPYLVEGKKTGGLELAEQCAEDPPDWVAASVGDGCSIAGVAKGLRQMREIGLIDWSAKMLGVQAAGCAPVGDVWRRVVGGDEKAKLVIEAGATTYADSINCPVPRNWRKAVTEVAGSGGAYVAVSDRQIMDAVPLTGRLTGVFAEPAAAAAVAGVAEAVRQGLIGPKSSVVAMITGNGLKDTAGALKAVGQAHEIEPRLEAVESVVKEGA